MRHLHKGFEKYKNHPDCVFPLSYNNFIQFLMPNWVPIRPAVDWNIFTPRRYCGRCFTNIPRKTILCLCDLPQFLQPDQLCSEATDLNRCKLFQAWHWYFQFHLARIVCGVFLACAEIVYWVCNCWVCFPCSWRSSCHIPRGSSDRDVRSVSWPLNWQCVGVWSSVCVVFVEFV